MKLVRELNKEKSKEMGRYIQDDRTPISHSDTPVKIPSYAWKSWLILGCIATMVMYAETMLIPAIPTLIKDFHMSYGLSTWLLTTY